MMKTPSLYRDFSEEAPAPAPEPAAPKSDDGASQRSRAAYDKGYSSGWDDATEAASRRNEAVAADLERAIQDMGFTYHEAVNQVQAEFSRFVSALLDAFLPSLTATGLRECLRAKIEEMAEPAGEVEVEIFIPPKFAKVFAPIAREDGVFPIKVIEEPSLTETQAFAKIGEIEFVTDFSELLTMIEMVLEEDNKMTEADIENGATAYG